MNLRSLFCSLILSIFVSPQSWAFDGTIKVCNADSTVISDFRVQLSNAIQNAAQRGIPLSHKIYAIPGYKTLEAEFDTKNDVLKDKIKQLAEDSKSRFFYKNLEVSKEIIFRQLDDPHGITLNLDNYNTSCLLVTSGLSVGQFYARKAARAKAQGLKDI